MDLNKMIAGKNITDLEKNILEYIVNNIEDIKDKGVRTVANETYTSPASVIRLSKKLGYSGYTDMYYSLLPIIKKEKLEEKNLENRGLNNSFSSIVGRLTEEEIKMFNRKVFKKSEKYVFIYATGFSKIISKYIYQKLLVLGRKAIIASGSDSAGIFENNLKDIGSILIISKSGETEQVYNKLKIGSEADIYSISFTQNTNNRIALLSDLNIPIRDTHQLDYQNMLPNTFFPTVLLSFEQLLEYHLNEI